MLALLSAASCVLLSATPERAGAPFSLEQLYTAPFPGGIGARYVSLSDDGRYVACGWNDEGLYCRNLWVYDSEAAQLTELTDLWPEHEARRRREFERSLARERKDWEKEHAKDEGAEEEGEAKEEDTEDKEVDESAEAVADEVEQEGEQEEFDEKKKREDFEEEIGREYRSFTGISETLWAPQSHEVFYIFGGVLYSIDLDQPAAAPLLRLRHEHGFASMSRVEGTSALLLISDADVVMWWPKEGRLRQLTSGGWSDYDNAAGYGVSHGGRWLAACSRDYTAMRKSTMWTVLDDDPQSSRQFYVRPEDGMETAKLRLFDLAEPNPWEIEVKLGNEDHFYVQNIEWSPVAGDERLLVSIIGGDTETHRTYLVTPNPQVAPGEDEFIAELIYREHDDAWINWEFTQARWTGEGLIVLHSEHSGMASLYRLDPPQPAAEPTEAPPGAALGEDEAASAESTTGTDEAGGDDDDNEAEEKAEVGSYVLVPLYEHDHEVTAVWALRRWPWVVFQVGQPDPTSRSLRAINARTGQLVSLAQGRDWRGDHVGFDDAETHFVYTLTGLRAQGNLVMLDLASALNGSAPSETTILDRRRAEWLAWSKTWNVSVFSVPSDKGDIWVKLYLPPDWRPGRKYPLLVWAHGAGYAQAVKQDSGHWELFHPWLAAEKGWMAVEVDWRASSGYGRDWRIAVQDQLGTPEVEDILVVKDYLEANYGADPQRSAIWGWSYGGFLTLMALGQAPGEFQAGCAVAPAIDWRNYNYWYGTCRLDSPKENEQAYEKSDATTYIENVTDRLLILHGLQDSNTLFQTVAQYIEEGHEKGVNVDLKLFPGGGHGIGRDFHYVAMYESMVEYIESSWVKASSE